MVCGGIHWSGVSVSGMGESQGGVLQQGPNIPFGCHLSGLIGGVLGGRPGGWMVVGKVEETMCHVTITCIHHFTKLVQFWGSHLCRFGKISLGFFQWGGGGNKWGGLMDSVLPIGRAGPKCRNCLNYNPLLGWEGPIHCVGLEVGGQRLGSH